MATLTMPTTPNFTASLFGLRAATQRFKSPLVGTVQTLELPGARWFVTYTLPLMTHDEAAPWQSFVVELMGASGRFFGFDPNRTTPRGVYDSGQDTPLVNGADQTGSSLITDGWRTSTTSDLLLPGDYFEVTADGKKELHMVIAAVDGDSGGNATITFKPPLRSSPNENAAIVLTDPVVEMHLVDDDQALWQATIGNFVPSFVFSAVEAF